MRKFGFKPPSEQLARGVMNDWLSSNQIKVEMTPFVFANKVTLEMKTAAMGYLSNLQKHAEQHLDLLNR